MPRLVIPSPTLIDQAFPRDKDELIIVAEAFGNLIEMIETNELELLLPESFREFVELFEWNQEGRGTILSEIYHLLSVLVLQGNQAVVRINTTAVTAFEPHPVPTRCENFGFVAEWSMEIGKVLRLHDDRLNDIANFCVGVSCAYGFAGECLDRYPVGHGRAFPLVGPGNVTILREIVEWKIDDSIRNATVTPTDFIRNKDVLQVEKIVKKPGSHRKVYFKNGTSWTLDMNWNRIDDSIIEQLQKCCGYPTDVVKSLILNGEEPVKVRIFP